VKYKDYKNLPEYARQEWIFNKLEDKIVSPISYGMWCVIFCVYIYLSVTILCIFTLLTYDAGRYAYLTPYIYSTMKVMPYLIIILVVDAVIRVGFSVYHGIKEQKWIKEVRENGK